MDEKTQKRPDQDPASLNVTFPVSFQLDSSQSAVPLHEVSLSTCRGTCTVHQTEDSEAVRSAIIIIFPIYIILFFYVSYYFF